MSAFSARLLRPAVVLLALLSLTGPLHAESTVVVGRKASTTGRVIAAQNIDLGGRVTLSVRRSAPVQHRWSDRVAEVRTTGGLVIPQVPHTHGIFTTNNVARDPAGETTTRSSHMNEAGVLILGNVLPVEPKAVLPDKDAIRPVNGLYRQADETPEDELLSASILQSLNYVLPTSADIERHRSAMLRQARLAEKRLAEKAEKDEAPADSEEKDPPEPQSIVSGLSRLMAERAGTAREAVQTGVQLVENYGWSGEVIQYVVADAREAWIMVVFPGRTAVARRVDDNEVVFTAEVNSLGEVDLLDEADVVVGSYTRERAKALLQAATSTVEAKQKELGDETLEVPKSVLFSLLNYTEPPTLKARLRSRSRLASVLKMLSPETEKERQRFLELDYREHRSGISLRPRQPVSPDALKSLMRSSAPDFFSVVGIANAATVRSTIYELSDDPWLTRLLFTTGMPTFLPYAPAYPLARRDTLLDLRDDVRPENATVPLASDVNSSIEYQPLAPVLGMAVRSHDVLTRSKKADAEERMAANTPLTSEFMTFEAQVELVRAQIEAEARFLAEKVSQEKAANRLTDRAKVLEERARGLIERTVLERSPRRFTTLVDELSPKDRTVRLLFLSTPDWNASQMVRRSLRLYETTVLPSGDVTRVDAESTAVNRYDFNGDGRPDAIVTFPVSELVEYALPDTATNFYVSGELEGGEPFIAYDTVRIVSGKR